MIDDRSAEQLAEQNEKDCIPQAKAGRDIGDTDDIKRNKTPGEEQIFRGLHRPCQ